MCSPTFHKDVVFFGGPFVFQSLLMICVENNISVVFEKQMVCKPYEWQLTFIPFQSFCHLTLAGFSIGESRSSIGRCYDFVGRWSVLKSSELEHIPVDPLVFEL